MPEVPEPEHEAQPIPKPGLCRPTITDKPVIAAAPPEANAHFTKWDYFCMGSRRMLKTALYGAGAAVVVAGAASFFGVPFLLSLKGAGLVVGGTAVMAGSGKIIEEKTKAEGKTPGTEKFITTVITIIVTVVMAIVNSRKKGGTK